MKKITLPKIQSNVDSILCVTFLAIFLTWLSYLLQIFPESVQLGDFFALLLIVFPTFGFFVGFSRSFEWGLFHSKIGTSVTFFTLSLLFWTIGQSIYFYSFKFDISENFYDYFFILMDPLILLGLLFLGSALGTFKEVRKNISILVLPVLLTILNYIIVSYIQNKDIFTAFLELDVSFIYIFGSLVTATLVVTLILFSKRLGGIYKKALQLILIGIIFQYIGDNIYELSAVESNGSWYDLFFFVSLTFISYGIYSLNPRKLNEKRS
jgi:hypothetical protein